MTASTPDDDADGARARELARGEAFAEGVARFDAGAYFEAHEAWEAIWLCAPRESAWRRCLQGLIQVAAGLHQWTARSRPESAARLLARGADKLARLPEDYAGLDLAGLRDAVDACRAQLAEHARGAPLAPPATAPRVRPARERR